MNGMNKIVAETKNLLLRYFTMDDVEKVYLMSIEEGMRNWIPDQVYKDEEESREVIEFLRSQYSDMPNPQKAPFVLGIEIKDSAQLIGHVGLSPYGDNVEIGYAIEDKHQGKGYGTEAVEAMSNWAIEALELPTVLGIVASDNRGSCRILEKAGYELVEEKEKKAFGRLCLCRVYKKEKQ